MQNNNPTLFIPDTPEYAALTDPPGGPICGLEPRSTSGVVEGAQLAVLELIDEGWLPAPRGKPLLALLDEVISRIENGQASSALALLHATGEVITALVRQGVLTQEQAEPLFYTIEMVAQSI